MRRRTPLPSRPCLLLLWLSWLVIITLGVSSCGEKTALKAAAADHTQGVKVAPAYRGGQYCVRGKATKYRAAGFECEHHHLVRR
jgi:hypothetical protein